MVVGRESVEMATHYQAEVPRFVRKARPTGFDDKADEGIEAEEPQDEVGRWVKSSKEEDDSETSTPVKVLRNFAQANSTRTKSLGRNMKNLLHVAVGGS